MSNNELDRFEILMRVNNARLLQSKAARMLGVSLRRVKRLLKRLRAEGPAGLIHKGPGAPSNNQRELRKTGS